MQATTCSMHFFECLFRAEDRHLTVQSIVFTFDRVLKIAVKRAILSRRDRMGIVWRCKVIILIGFSLAHCVTFRRKLELVKSIRICQSPCLKISSKDDTILIRSLSFSHFYLARLLFWRILVECSLHTAVQSWIRRQSSRVRSGQLCCLDCRCSDGADNC